MEVICNLDKNIDKDLLNLKIKIINLLFKMLLIKVMIFFKKNLVFQRFLSKKLLN